MRNFIGIIFFLLWSCKSEPPKHIPANEFRKTFEADSRSNLMSFIPTEDELLKFEDALKINLENLTKSGVGFERNVLKEVHPLEYSLGWYKRRYFGRIENNGTRKIYTELVFVRCGGSDKWKQINYAQDYNADCWWSVEYNLDKNEIEKINYP